MHCRTGPGVQTRRAAGTEGPTTMDARTLLDEATYSREEIEKLAAYRIGRVIELFGKPDGGFSYGVDSCQTSWVGIDMAPKLPQSDAMGLCILSMSINVCIDILGIQDATNWTGEWHIHPGQRESDKLRERLIAALRLA